MNPLRAIRIKKFDILSSALGFNATFGLWIRFFKLGRNGAGSPWWEEADEENLECFTTVLSWLKNWKESFFFFFWEDASLAPIVKPWRSGGGLRDPISSDNALEMERFNLLVANKIAIWTYPEEVLVLA